MCKDCWFSKCNRVLLHQSVSMAAAAAALGDMAAGAALGYMAAALGYIAAAAQMQTFGDRVCF